MYGFQARKAAKENWVPGSITRNQPKPKTVILFTLSLFDINGFCTIPEYFMSPRPQVRDYTSPPPDLAQWNGTGGGGGDQVAVATEIAVGTRVECLFKDTEDPSEVGAWYAGTVKSQNESGSWKIKFDDGDEGDFQANDPDLRLEDGPWATWLDIYLPNLLISAYRAARKEPYKVEIRYFYMLQNPEDFEAIVTDSAEFQPRNFCDVAVLPDVVDLCDDAVSVAETPAKKNQRRR